MELTAKPETLRVEESPGVLRVTLDRPGSQNSITPALLDELHRALDLAVASSSCRIVLIEGRGDVFCTGMDLEVAAQQAASGEAPSGGDRFLGLLKRFSTIPRAVVSRVDGLTSGGGVGIVAASDFAYATERSRFSLPEALWGLLPCCVLPFLIRRVGFQKAYAMTLSTQPVSGREAELFHLVDGVTDDVAPLIRRLLLRLEKLDERTLRDLKQYFRKMWFLSEEMEATALEEFDRLMSSAVVRQRISDFVTRQKFPWERE